MVEAKTQKLITLRQQLLDVLTYTEPKLCYISFLSYVRNKWQRCLKGWGSLSGCSGNLGVDEIWWAQVVRMSVENTNSIILGTALKRPKSSSSNLYHLSHRAVLMMSFPETEFCWQPAELGSWMVNPDHVLSCHLVESCSGLRWTYEEIIINAIASTNLNSSETNQSKCKHYTSCANWLTIPVWN